MMHRKIYSKLCRLCGKEKQRGTDLFNDKIKGAVLCSIINKYFSKEVINIGVTDAHTKYVCMDCEIKICTFDEFCLMVANVQKQLAAPTLEIDFAEGMLCHLKENENSPKAERRQSFLSKKLHTCPLCTKRFRCQAHVERHKRIHTGQRPFTCNICAMSFNQQEILNKHRASHEGKKEFRCANCHQSFRFKVSLKSHMINYHSDDEKFPINKSAGSLVCTECGKFFATRYKLKRHARSHTRERPYACNYCKRKFSQSGNQKFHESKCQQQNFAFSSSLNSNGNLDYHENDKPMNLASSCTTSRSTGCLESSQTTLENFQHYRYINETEIQKTINETINSESIEPASSSYLIKNYENPIYIDNEIENILDRDLGNLEASKFSSAHEKLPVCLKQPETPELLHSLLYDD